jgi:hypothetical protein
MDKGVLTELLVEASGRKAKGNTFEFSEQDKASVLVSTGGPMLLIEEVSRVELKDGYTLVRAGRADLFVIETERVIGVRLQRSRRDGAGFVSS